MTTDNVLALQRHVAATAALYDALQPRYAATEVHAVDICPFRTAPSALAPARHAAQAIPMHLRAQTLSARPGCDAESSTDLMCSSPRATSLKGIAAVEK